MTQQEIQERNKQIALMLGADVQDVLERIYVDKMVDSKLTFHNISVNLNTYEWNGVTNIHYIPFDMLQFHSDWNWLMEAVEFIQSLRLDIPKYNVVDYYIVTSSSTFCNIRSGLNHADGETKSPFFYDKSSVGKNQKEATFLAVSDFAKKFNKKEL